MEQREDPNLMEARPYLCPDLVTLTAALGHSQPPLSSGGVGTGEDALSGGFLERKGRVWAGLPGP
ncbi:hypothetical protein D623_10029183 [Myotis brandtii]|uniref:Uncharacterized protein n=1 Tax=Myotis brandtii TaxID=109478 RepID=S7PFN7_MYOBR|nr:hypothetical protein D623_10029183 [Myotis brandtii]